MWTDALFVLEELVRVVLGLDLTETRIVVAVVGSRPVGDSGVGDVDVGTLQGTVARPCGIALSTRRPPSAPRPSPRPRSTRCRTSGFRWNQAVASLGIRPTLPPQLRHQISPSRPGSSARNSRIVSTPSSGISLYAHPDGMCTFAGVSESPGQLAPRLGVGFGLDDDLRVTDLQQRLDDFPQLVFRAAIDALAVDVAVRLGLRVEDRTESVVGNGRDLLPDRSRRLISSSRPRSVRTR